LREPVIGPVVTVRGAANLGISFMAVSSRTSPTTGTGGPNRGARPLRPFAGMTRIRFKGFGLSPSQPHSGRPSSKINVVLAAQPVNPMKVIACAAAIDISSQILPSVRPPPWNHPVS